jgi:hypothetical protein
MPSERTERGRFAWCRSGSALPSASDSSTPSPTQVTRLFQWTAVLNAAEILAGLGRVANEAFAYAVVWHLVIGSVSAGLWLGWRPSPRLAGGLLCLPLVSVSGFAWAFGNPFNGSSFALLAILLGWIAWRRPQRAAMISRRWTTALGGLLVAFAWSYPHFLVGRPALSYLIGAPLGLIPCPTLSLVIGVALLGYGPNTKGWSFALAAAGVFYALFGALRLGVVIDLALLAGSIAIGARAMPTGKPTPFLDALGKPLPGSVSEKICWSSGRCAAPGVVRGLCRRGADDLPDRVGAARFPVDLEQFRERGDARMVKRLEAAPVKVRFLQRQARHGWPPYTRVRGVSRGG